MTSRHVLLLALLLPGCTLIDQRFFNPQAGVAPVIPPAPTVAAAPTAGPPPLLVIAPGAAFEDPLRRAVAAARARKPSVLFDVVEMQPPDLATDAPLGTDAVLVARQIVDQGVAPANVRLAARPEAAVRPGEVRVYVR